MNPLAAVLGPLYLAQVSDGPYSPPPLPSPPMLERWLCENPWPPAIALAAAAVLVFFILNSRSRAKQGVLIAVGLLAVAAACIVTSFVVTTEREKLAARTRELIAATATADLRELGPMLASDIGLSVLGQPFQEDKDGILGLVNRYMGSEYPVKSHSVSNTTATTDRAGGGKTLVRVRVEVNVGGSGELPNRSWWRITWRKGADGEWQAMRIEALQIDMVQPSMLPR